MFIIQYETFQYNVKYSFVHWIHSYDTDGIYTFLRENVTMDIVVVGFRASGLCSMAISFDNWQFLMLNNTCSYISLNRNTLNTPWHACPPPPNATAAGKISHTERHRNPTGVQYRCRRVFLTSHFRVLIISSYNPSHLKIGKILSPKMNYWHPLVSYQKLGLECIY